MNRRGFRIDRWWDRGERRGIVHMVYVFVHWEGCEAGKMYRVLYPPAFFLPWASRACMRLLLFFFHLQRSSEYSSTFLSYSIFCGAAAFYHVYLLPYTTTSNAKLHYIIEMDIREMDIVWYLIS